MKRICLSAMIMLAAVAGPALAVEAPLTDKLPAGTIVYVGWAGQNDALAGSAYGKLLADPLVANSFKALMDGLDAKAKQDGDVVAAISGIKLATMLLKHPLAIGVLAIDADQPQNTPTILVADMGDDKAAFQAEIDKLSAMAGEAVKKVSVGGFDVLMLETPEVVLVLGWEGNLLKVALSKAGVEAAFPQRPATYPVLSSNARFKADLADVTLKQAQMTMWVDVKTITDKLLPAEAAQAATTQPRMGPPPPRKIVEALGLSGVTSIVSVGGFDGLATISEMRINSPAPHKGVLSLLAGKPLPAGILADAPADTIFAGAFSMSPSAVLAEVLRVAGELDPELPQHIMQSIDQVNGMLGINTEEVLASIGDDWQIVSAPSLGGYLTGTVITVGLKDSTKFGQAVDGVTSRFVQEGAPVKMSKLATKGQAISYIYGDADARYGEPTPLSFVSPAWAITKDKLLIAPYPQPLKSVFEAPAGGKLGDEKMFKSLRARLPKDASGLCYANMTGLMPLYYSYALPLYNMGASFARPEGFNLLPEWMPTLASVSPYFTPEMTAISHGDKGIVITSVSEGASTSSISPAVLAFGVSIALPAVSQARQNAKMVVATQSLRGIGIGAVLWQAENRDAFPPDLAALIVQGQSPELLRSPFNAAPPPKLVDGKLVGESDYIYIKPGKDAASSTIMGYLKPQYAVKGQVPVLFADGHVEQWPVWRLEQALKAPAGADERF